MGIEHYNTNQRKNPWERHCQEGHEALTIGPSPRPISPRQPPAAAANPKRVNPQTLCSRFKLVFEPPESERTVAAISKISPPSPTSGRAGGLLAAAPPTSAVSNFKSSPTRPQPPTPPVPPIYLIQSIAVPIPHVSSSVTVSRRERRGVSSSTWRAAAEAVRT